MLLTFQEAQLSFATFLLLFFFLGLILAVLSFITTCRLSVVAAREATLVAACGLLFAAASLVEHKL